MGLWIRTTDDALASGCRLLASPAGRGRDAVWVLPSEEQALARRKTLATAEGEPSAGFGAICTSLVAYLDDRWELFGSGCACVSALQRSLLVRSALRSVRGQGLAAMSDTPGVVDLLARMVKVGFGLPAFVEAMERSGCSGSGGEASDLDLSSTEIEMLHVADAYRSLLREAGLCERSEAMRALAENPDVLWPTFLVEDVRSLDPHEAYFYSRIGRRADVVFLLAADAGSQFDPACELEAQLRALGADVERARDDFGRSGLRDGELEALSAALFCPQDNGAVEPSGALQFVLPAGRYAQARALADAIKAQESGEVLVVCKDPLSLGAELSPLLSGQGIAVEARCSKSFGQTDFGRALLGAWALAEGTAADPSQATDVALCALLDLDRETASLLDAKWRGSRPFRPQEALSDLMERTDAKAGAFLAAVSQGDFTEACQTARGLYESRGALSSALRAENASAVQVALRFVEATELSRGSCQDGFDLLAQQAVPCSCAWFPPSQDGRRQVEKASKTVLVMTYESASRRSAASCDVLFACNLNDSEQSVRLARSPLDGLFETLGCAVPRDALVEQRVRFAAVLRTARTRVVLSRILNDERSSPLNPAVVFEDVVDCYRARDGGEGGVDRATGLPEGLAAQSFVRGEETLHANLGGAEAEAPLSALQTEEADFVSEDSLPLVVLSRGHDGGGVSKALPTLSPSAMEDYLDCPHKWFVNRRLRLSGVDAEFGPREKGSFAHAVLRRYYERWQEEQGCAKAGPGQLAEARRLLDEVFDEEAAAQPMRDPRENPLIPVTEAEKREMEELRQSLEDFLDRDVQLLPGFAPSLFEQVIDEEAGVEYAGFLLRGKIDRVDFDDKGRAVIVDYKSSLSEDHCLLSARGAEFSLPVKVQTLVYAQALRRLTGIEVVGALYVNIVGGGSKPMICGAYDDRVLGPFDLPGVDVERNAMSCAGFSTFGDLLDAVEEMAAFPLAHMVQGDIAACPRGAGACTYCPVQRCGKRAVA